MSSQQDLSARNQAHDDRTVHLGGLQFKMSREEIAAVVASHGLQDCVFYWPNKPAQYQHHTGWCCVEFRDVTSANLARQKLHGAHFGGRPARAGRPGKAPGRASSGQPNLSSTGQPNFSSTGQPNPPSSVGQAHLSDGWFPSVVDVPNDLDIDEQCDRVVDVMTIDEPWKDTERLFERGINATNYPGGSQWFPGAVLDRPIVDGIPQGKLTFCATQCISNAPRHLNQGDTGADFRTATSAGHVAIVKRPQDIGFGWGGYDNFHQWQANGRQIDPRDVEPHKWQFDVREMVLVEEGSGKETKFDIKEGSALDRFIGHPQDGEGTTENELESLYTVSNPSHKLQKKGYTGGRGGGEW